MNIGFAQKKRKMESGVWGGLRRRTRINVLTLNLLFYFMTVCCGESFLFKWDEVVVIGQPSYTSGFNTSNAVNAGLGSSIQFSSESFGWFFVGWNSTTTNQQQQSFHVFDQLYCELLFFCSSTLKIDINTQQPRCVVFIVARLSDLFDGIWIIIMLILLIYSSLEIILQQHNNFHWITMLLTIIFPVSGTRTFRSKSSFRNMGRIKSEFQTTTGSSTKLCMSSEMLLITTRLYLLQTLRV